MSGKFDLKKDIEFVLESKDIDLEFFAKKTDVSRKTIYNQINNPTNFKTLDKIYNQIYDLGIRLNKIKAELFDENNKNDELILYHGSKNGITKLLCNGSRNDCDFGAAFYLTKILDSAISFIEGFNESLIYVYKLNIKGLKVVKFSTDYDWLLLICYFRKKMVETSHIKNILNKVKNSDLIIAPIADNKMFEIINQFLNGYISSGQALHALSASRLGLQYVLRTDKAINQLKIIDHLFVCSKEKEASKRNSIERSNEIETKINFAKKEYRNEGFYIDEILK